MIRQCLDVSDVIPMIKHTLYTNRGLHIHLTKKTKLNQQSEK